MRRLASAGELMPMLLDWAQERHDHLQLAVRLATFVAVALLVEQRWPGAALAVVPGAVAVVLLQAHVGERCPQTLRRLVFGEGAAGEDVEAEVEVGDAPGDDGQRLRLSEESRRRDGVEEDGAQKKDLEAEEHEDDEDNDDEYDFENGGELEERWLHLDRNGLPVDADGIVPIGDHLLEGFPWQSAQAFMSEQRLVNEYGQEMAEMADGGCEDGDMAGQSDQMSKARLDLLFRYMASMEGRSHRDVSANPLRQKLQRKLLQRNAAGAGKVKAAQRAGVGNELADTGGNGDVGAESGAAADALEDPSKIEELLRELGEEDSQPRSLEGKATGIAGGTSGSASKKTRRKGAGAAVKVPIAGSGVRNGPLTPKKASSGAGTAVDSPGDGDCCDGDALEAESPPSNGHRGKAAVGSPPPLAECPAEGPDRGTPSPAAASPAASSVASPAAGRGSETLREAVHDGDDWEWQCPLGHPLLPGSAERGSSCSSCHGPLARGAPVMRSAASGWTACEDCILVARERPVEEPLPEDPARMTPAEVAAWFQRRGAEDALRECMARVLAAEALAAEAPSEAAAEAPAAAAARAAAAAAENGRRKRRTGR